MNISPIKNITQNTRQYNKQRQITFTHNFPLCKDCFQKLPQKTLCSLGVDFWGLEGTFSDKESTLEMLYHPNYETFLKKLEFAENFPDYEICRKIYDYDVYNRPMYSSYYVNNIDHLKTCFEGSVEEQQKKQNFALYLKENGFSAKEISSIINSTIKDKKVDDNLVDFVKLSIKKTGKPIELNDSFTSYLKQKGFSADNFIQITKQHLNEEELSEEQLDILADINLYSKISRNEFSSVMKIFSDLNLENRIEEEEIIDNPDGVSSKTLKSKYSTYYAIANSSQETYLTKEHEKNYITNHYNKVRGSRYLSEQFSKSLSENERLYYDYYMEFPKGNWTQVIPFDIEGRNYFQNVTCEYDYEKLPISLPDRRTIYFEKINI